jgi:hypothetical protein
MWVIKEGIVQIKMPIQPYLSLLFTVYRADGINGGNPLKSTFKLMRQDALVAFFCNRINYLM